MGDDLIWPASLAALTGVGVLRFAWSRAQRSKLANAGGWGLLALATVLAAAEAGAWGVSVAWLFAMLAAAILLGWAAAFTPAGRTKAAERRVRILPEAGEPLFLGRRVLTFVLVMGGGFATSVAFAIALRGGTLAVGWAEADANAAALLAVPIVWGVLATIVLMQHTRRAQFLTLALATLPLFPALLAGS